MTDDKQKRLNVTFRKNDEEQKLYDYAQLKGKVGGVSNYVKALILKDMEQDHKEEK